MNELHEKDPEFCLSADLKNPVRVIRALEVIRMTNQPYSSLRKGFKNDLPYDIVRFSIAWKREDLYDRINLRVDEMIMNGLVEEVKGLQEFQEHLGGQLTITLLLALGKGIEVHEIDFEMVKKSVDYLANLA